MVGWKGGLAAPQKDEDIERSEGGGMCLKA